MNLVPDEMRFGALILAILIQTLIGFLFRKKLAGLFDLFFLNLTYVAFGTSGLIFFYMSAGNSKVLDELILLFFWLSGTLLGSHVVAGNTVRHRVATSMPHPGRQSGTRYDMICFILVCGLYLLYAVQILTSGIFSLDSAVIDNRFLVQQNNKFQAYLFSAAGLLPGILLFRVRPKLTSLKFFFAITPFWITQASTFSKTGFLFPVIAGSLYYSLKIKGSDIPKPDMRRQLLYLCITAASIYLIFTGITEFVINSEISAFTLLLDRLLSSFDGLAYLSSINLSKEGSLSLLQFYLSPFLKVLGLYNQPYNAFNYVLAVEFFGQPADYSGMLPNNNHIGEIVVAFTPYFRAPVAILSGFLYGFIYNNSVRYVLRGGLFLIPAAFVVATPFGFLIDGQGWAIAFFSSLVLMLICTLISTTIKLLAFVARRPGLNIIK
jgi:hypothetical protein